MPSSWLCNCGKRAACPWNNSATFGPEAATLVTPEIARAGATAKIISLRLVDGAITICITIHSLVGVTKPIWYDVLLSTGSSAPRARVESTLPTR